MNKVLVSTQRFLQNIYPFQGKIVFTLKGDNSELVTSFIPEQSIFCNSIAVSHLVPNSLIEDATTYYHYAIYPQGHVPGIFLSEPVEEGDCIVPEHDCVLDDIISPVPDQNTAEKIIADASSMIAEIRSSIQRAEECARQACSAAQQTNGVASLVQKGEQYYLWTKDRQEQVEQATQLLDDYQANINQMIDSIFQQKTSELEDSIHHEQQIVNDLWNRIHQMYSGLDTVTDLLNEVRNLHDTYIADMSSLREYVNSISIKTKLSEFENDILEPITNQEINTLYGA